MKIVPAEATINELEQQASEYESKAKEEIGPDANGLLEKAKQCRAWIAALKSGKWIS